MFKASLAPVVKTGRLIDRAPTPDMLQPRFVEVARAGRARFLESNTRALGSPPGVTDITDGVIGAGPETAELHGAIYVARYDATKQAIEFALALLVRLSPRKTGFYASRHIVLMGGVEVDRPFGNDEGRTIWIADVAIYAGDVEARHSPYFTVAAMVKNRFGRIFDVQMGYRQITVSGERRVRPGQKHYAGPIHHPTIILKRK